MVALRTALWLAAALTTVACGEKSGGCGALDSRTVALPDGFEECAELKVTPQDMAKGMMYRDSLNNGSGMLFVNQQPVTSPYWMANCKIPLDIVWMDANRKVVEISAATPPCPSGDSECPTYGGHFPAQYVLEIGAGEAAKHQVLQGSTLKF